MGKKHAKAKSSGDVPSLEEFPSISAEVPAFPCQPPNAEPRRNQGQPRIVKGVSAYKDLIYVIPDFFLPSESAAWIRYGEATGFELAHQTGGRGYASRNNGRISFHSPETAAALYQRVRAFVPERLSNGWERRGCISNIRLYRYEPGQSFGKHVDESVDDGEGGRSEFTMLIYLNGSGSASIPQTDNGSDDPNQDELVGGETIFYKGNIGNKVALQFAPMANACLLHGHGSRCLLHEGAKVIRGVKYLLRSDVVYGPAESAKRQKI
eukprot:c16605_g1_i1.p2 GENE.c16605_g1_i1~~c16605_g1_i1.p2  ORF type:complete len:278 (+),score=46.18 c16605_g1_i1:39-836(+)